MSTAVGLAVYVSVLGIKGAHGTTARAVVSVVVPTILFAVVLIASIAGLLFFLYSQEAFDQPPGA